MLSLRLKNYRRFLDEIQVDFAPGLTIITGPNGAGKTTLVEAISHVIFGPRRGRGAISARSDNAAGDLEVACTFQIDEHDVQVARSGSVVELCLDGTNQVTAAPGSATQVNRQLGQLLGGLTREQFEKIYVAEQGQTAGLVSDKPSERQEILEVALQMDVLKEARDVQEDERKRASTEVEVLGRAAADTLGFTTGERQVIDEFGRARQARKGEYLDRFLAQVNSAVAAHQDAARQAEMEHQSALELVAEVAKVHDNCQHEFDRLQTMLVGHAERKSKFDAYDREIIRQETLLEAASEAAKKRGEEIARALDCEEAATRHNTAGLQLATVNARLSRLPQIEDRWKAREEKHGEVSALEAEIQALGDPESDQAQAEVKEAEARRTWQTLQSADPTVEDAADLQRRQGALDLQRQQAEAATATLEQGSEDARCPTCDQRLTAHARELRLAHLRSWLNNDLPTARQELEWVTQRVKYRKQEWSEAVQRAEHDWRQASNDVEKAKSRCGTLVTLRSQFAQARNRLVTAEAAWEDLGESGPWDPQEQDSLKAQAAELRGQIMKLQADAELYAGLDRLRRELEQETEKERQAGDELERLRIEQAATGYDAAAHVAAKAEVEVARAHLDQAAGQLSTAEKLAGEQRIQAALARQKANSAVEAEKRLCEAQAGYRRGARLAGLLSAFYTQFFARNTGAIARRAGELIAQAVTDGSVAGLSFAQDGELHYLDASYMPQPVGRLSGGEKALVGLCLRIALAEQALRIARTGKLHFLILDEVLSSLDDDRREAIQRVLDDVQRQGIFEHIVMITHLESVKQGWQGAWLEVEKVGPKTSRINVATVNILGSDALDTPIAFPDEDADG
jgi:DNA repair exonuclease SbcCD ATPase subunit